MKLSGLADWSRRCALLLSGHLLNAIELKNLQASWPSLLAIS
jgi:hypothetical protein